MFNYTIPTILVLCKYYFYIMASLFMKRTDVKSHCPINHALEAIGDPWSLLILRDIVYFGKHTYGEFLAANERITTSVLANRLDKLEEKGILRRVQHEQDKRKANYVLTSRGLDLIPIILDMEAWGGMHDPKTVKRPNRWLEIMKKT